MARPTKLTPELQKQICDLLAAGNFVETVCDYVGIDYKTFYNWLTWGERGYKDDVARGYAEFFHAVKKATSQVEVLTVHELRGRPDDWQALAWWLERRHPDKWGNRGKSQIEHSGKVEIDVSRLSDDELEALASA